MESYRLEYGKFVRADIGQVTMNDLMRGPYALRFQCEGFAAPHYFAGDDEETFAKLIREGKWVTHLAHFVDNMRHHLLYHEIDVVNTIAGMTFNELQDKIKSIKITKSSKKILDNSLE